jgi:hypothetical protein
MEIKIKETEWRKLKEHLMADISYGGGGTFTKHDNNNTEDTKEIERVAKIIMKIDNQI